MKPIKKSLYFSVDLFYENVVYKLVEESARKRIKHNIVIPIYTSKVGSALECIESKMKNNG